MADKELSITKTSRRLVQDAAGTNNQPNIINRLIPGKNKDIDEYLQIIQTLETARSNETDKSRRVDILKDLNDLATDFNPHKVFNNIELLEKIIQGNKLLKKYDLTKQPLVKETNKDPMAEQRMEGALTYADGIKQLSHDLKSKIKETRKDIKEYTNEGITKTKQKLTNIISNTFPGKSVTQDNIEKYKSVAAVLLALQKQKDSENADFMAMHNYLPSDKINDYKIMMEKLKIFLDNNPDMILKNKDMLKTLKYGDQLLKEFGLDK